MLGRINGAVRFREPLSFHTSLRIGGPAEIFIMPQDLDDLRYALAFAEHEDMPLVVIGGGSNLLVSDRALPGVVVKLQGILGGAEFAGDEVAVGAGMPLSALIREAAGQGLAGLEYLAGIPATVGGALATNARTPEGAFIKHCQAIYFLHPDGTLGEHRAWGPTGWRTFDLPPGGILVGCRLRLERRPPQVVQKTLQYRLKAWKESQPFDLAAAGYIWKNPPGDRAARLVEMVGLRGKRVNGAEISMKSTNLIVNRGGATQDDILALMEMAHQRVEKRLGITLQPEIRLVGFPARAPFEAQPMELSAAR
jgi:UDP-N-acetylmuramate dehydrogenase